MRPGTDCESKFSLEIAMNVRVRMNTTFANIGQPSFECVFFVELAQLIWGECHKQYNIYKKKSFF